MIIKQKSNIFIGIILLFLAYLIFKNDGNHYNVYVLSLSFIISGFSVLNLLYSKAKPFSLNNITYLFFLFFLGIAPAFQFKNSISFLGEFGKLSDSDFLKGNLLFLGVLVLYTLSYKLIANKLHNNDGSVSIKKEIKPYALNINNKHIIFLAILFTIAFFTFFDFKFEAIFLRSYLWKNKSGYNTPILATFNVLRGSPLLLFLYYKLGTKKSLFTEILLLVIILICNFPTAIPRYKSAIIYLPIIIIYVKPFFKKYYFSLIFVLSFLTVFPYLSHFRYNSKLIPDKIFDFEMFNTQHFDSYQNSINVITKNVNTNGEQLLSTIFFFVPRAIWEDKSVGSGHILAKELNYNGFSNVAVSYFAEGYINFGFIGMLIFTIFLAYINTKLDSLFWYKQNLSIYTTIIYLILIPFLFFILRGSLLASFANLFGYIFITLAIYLLLLKTPRFLSSVK